MKTNKKILTDLDTTELKSVDQLLEQRDINKNKQVEINDSLIQKYNIELFDNKESNIGVANDATQLFYENSNIGTELSQSKTENLFTGDTVYHQSNVTTYKHSTMILVMWLLAITIISMLITKVVRRRKYAKKNRNSSQIAQLYY